MKIKIKDFKGIYSNIDENDKNFEYATQDSVNFYHKRGFVEFEPRALTARADLPTPTFGSLTWTWETGIYTTLTTDVLTTEKVATPASYDVLVLIAKATDSGTDHRLVYLYDGSWQEMSNFSSPTVNSVPLIDIVNWDGVDFDQSFFSTTRSGTTYFQVENGRLKIYMPHDTFWLGKLNRKIWVKDGKVRADWGVTEDGTTTFPNFDYEGNYWYIDRVVDFWDHTRQTVNIPLGGPAYNYPQTSVDPATADLTTLKCALPDVFNSDYRRTGVIYEIGYNDTQTHIVGGREVTMGGPHDHQVRKEEPLSNIRCQRISITDAADPTIPVRNPDKPFPNSPEIWLFPIDRTRTSAIGPADWAYAGTHPTSTDYANTYIIFNKGQERLFRLVSGDEWSNLAVIPSYVAYSASGLAPIWIDEANGTMGGAAFSISLRDFYDNAIEYTGNDEVADVGWLIGENQFSIAVTMVLDEREEIPVHVYNYAPEVTDKYIIEIRNIEIPWDINKRITRLRFYHKLKDGADFELVKDFDLLSAEDSIENFEFSANDYTGDLLSANIGFLWDYFEHPGDLKLVNGFLDFITESGVSIGIASNDQVAIYHSTFGGGKLMPDLIYDDNRIPITGVSKLTGVANADGRLIAFTINTGYAIKADEVAGVLGFVIEDTIELGVKDKNDIANAQGGVVVHTQHGIYLTNGFQTTLLSEAIDDIVIANYSTGRIYYNRYKHEILYKPTNSEDLYRYRAKDKVWEKNDKTAAG